MRNPDDKHWQNHSLGGGLRVRQLEPRDDDEGLGQRDEDVGRRLDPDVEAPGGRGVDAQLYR